MKRYAAAALLLVIAGCSDSADNAATPAEPAKPAEVASEPAAPAGEKTPAEILAGGMANTIGPEGAKGCKDKAKAMALVEAGKKDDPTEMIDLWAAGMQDQSCRGYTAGLGVSVEKTEDGWSCILAIDDPDNKTCLWVEASAIAG